VNGYGACFNGKVGQAWATVLKALLGAITAAVDAALTRGQTSLTAE
jgi:hypothetical protein